MTNTVSTLNPSLATDIVRVCTLANRKFHPNSGQTGTLSAIAMLQMTKAAQPVGTHDYSGTCVFPSQVKALTNLSESSVKSHIRFWVERGVLNVHEVAVGKTYYVNLGA